MATHETTIHPFPAQGRTPLTITSEQISHYAELAALVSELESQQKTLRAELLKLQLEVAKRIGATVNLRTSDSDPAE